MPGDELYRRMCNSAPIGGPNPAQTKTLSDLDQKMCHAPNLPTCARKQSLGQRSFAALKPPCPGQKSVAALKLPCPQQPSPALPPVKVCQEQIEIYEALLICPGSSIDVLVSCPSTPEQHEEPEEQAESICDAGYAWHKWTCPSSPPLGPRHLVWAAGGG